MNFEPSDALVKVTYRLRDNSESGWIMGIVKPANNMGLHAIEGGHAPTYLFADEVVRVRRVRLIDSFAD